MPTEDLENAYGGEKGSEVNNQKLYLEPHDNQIFESHLETIKTLIHDIKDIDAYLLE